MIKQLIVAASAALLCAGVFYVLIQCLHVKVVLPYPVNWLMFSNFSITQGKVICH